jgi:uncharacterized protein YabE (DUF348 family)
MSGGPRRVVAAAVVAVAVFVGLRFGFAKRAGTVTIVADGRALVVSPRGRTVGELLALEGIPVGSGDKVVPDPASVLEPGMLVTVERPVRVTILADGNRTIVECLGLYVRDALKTAGVDVSGRDLVQPEADEELEPGMTVCVRRMTEELVTGKVQVPFQVLRREDENLEIGISKVVQQGRPGSKEVVTRLLKLDGKVIERQTIGERVLEKPVPQVVAIGTCGVISRGGQTIRFKKALDVVATAYTPGPESTGPSADGYTATGLKAGFGVIAVDPRVIKLGSRVYVEGYGFAIAGDVGGAIKGARIDVCFESKSEALRWGRRKVRVYIL